MANPELKIGKRFVGNDHPCFVIAEAGVNHNGDVNLALKLIDKAKKAGADAVKFQTFSAEKVASSCAPKAKYQLETTDSDESQLDMLRKLALDCEDHRRLAAHCRENDIIFLSSPFDKESADFLHELAVPAFKIPSGEITNHDLLTHVAQKGIPLIVSTGMCFLNEVEEAVNVIRAAGCRELALLHCVSDYPAKPESCNLRAMQTLKRSFDVPTGFSDHTQGSVVALAAVALGACIIEKHFTLDNSMAGPDHKASCEPDELAALISDIRVLEQSLGSGEKRPADCEIDNRRIVRRSIAAKYDLPEGTVIKDDMLTCLRPADGIAPFKLDELMGRTLSRALKAGQLMTWDDLE